MIWPYHIFIRRFYLVPVHTQLLLLILLSAPTVWSATAFVRVCTFLYNWSRGPPTSWLVFAHLMNSHIAIIRKELFTQRRTKTSWYLLSRRRQCLVRMKRKTHVCSMQKSVKHWLGPATSTGMFVSRVRHWEIDLNMHSILTVPVRNNYLDST